MARPEFKVRLYITGGIESTKCHETVIDAQKLAALANPNYDGDTIQALNSLMIASSDADAYVSVDDLMSVVFEHFGMKNLRKALLRRGITKSWGVKYCMWTMANYDDLPECVLHESGGLGQPSTRNKGNCIGRPQDQCVGECKWTERESESGSGSFCMPMKRNAFVNNHVVECAGRERELSSALWDQYGEKVRLAFGNDSIAEAGIAFNPDGVTHVVVMIKFTENKCQEEKVRKAYKTALRRYYSGTMTQEQEQLWEKLIEIGVKTDCDTSTAECFARTFATWLMKLKEPNGEGAKIALDECSITTNNPYLDDGSRAMFELDDYQNDWDYDDEGNHVYF